MWENRPSWKDVECKTHGSWKRKYKTSMCSLAQQERWNQGKSPLYKVLWKFFSLLTVGSKKTKCWFPSFHWVPLSLTGFQMGVTSGWASLWWCQRAAQAQNVTSEQCSCSMTPTVNATWICNFLHATEITTIALTIQVRHKFFCLWIEITTMLTLSKYR